MSANTTNASADQLLKDGLSAQGGGSEGGLQREANR